MRDYKKNEAPSSLFDWKPQVIIIIVIFLILYTW